MPGQKCQPCFLGSGRKKLCFPKRTLAGSSEPRYKARKDASLARVVLLMTDKNDALTKQLEEPTTSAKLPAEKNVDLEQRTELLTGKNTGLEQQAGSRRAGPRARIGPHTQAFLRAAQSLLLTSWACIEAGLAAWLYEGLVCSI